MSMPKDPIMLLSFVNTKLRDEYLSLDDFCNSENCDKNEITAKLKSINYMYSTATNQFI